MGIKRPLTNAMKNKPAILLTLAGLALIILIGWSVSSFLAPPAQIPVIVIPVASSTPAEVASTTPTVSTTTPVAPKGKSVASISTATSTVAPAPVYELQTVNGTALTTSNILALVNNERIAAGLAPLADNELLDTAAANKLHDMETNHYFAHVSPSGATPWSWLTAVGYDYKFAGENLAEDFPTAQTTMAAWIASPTHYANIMKPEYTQTGIATDGTITVEEFASQAK